ncbi:NAD(P)/FAD-dependent oxidoreductase [Fluviispira multicolorata]|uniref:FAD-dependent oxidoreductase n=1 Tax=Fluviispira multicolorata TaxID=2654512 RepID=A0A833JAK3_9BACT|nr:NAD(P)/FAD-dependent oxidoreductase [Fluviispira multicolorata]KAB8028114.1 FAD-dependent oxidoreductase [Fluviispira multicolorata]
MKNEVMYSDFIIIGAGVLGLNLAAQLSKRYPEKSIALLERSDRFGTETSSRNSEVIHAGIYYDENSLKAKYCVKGNKLLYSFCNEYSIPFLKCGKYIVSSTEEQDEIILDLQNKALKNGVNLKFLNKDQLKSDEKMSHFRNALYSSETGIIDSHKLMQTLEQMAKYQNVALAYRNSFVKLIDVGTDGIVFEACDENGNSYYMRCQYFLNAGGLSSAKIANNFVSREVYKTKACRGRYYSLPAKYNNYFNKLIYPIPDPSGCVGIHITFELDGKFKLGPDVDWSFAESNDADDQNLYKFFDMRDDVKEKFYVEGKRLIPTLELKDLSPNYIGVRPKLFIDNKLEEDFHIKKIREGNNMSVHFLGIESPGLTSSMAIAEDLLEEFK